MEFFDPKPALTGHYIPNFIYNDKTLPPNAKLVYTTLVMHSKNGISKISQREVADILGISTKTVLRMIKHLIKENLIETINNRKGFTPEANQYIFNSLVVTKSHPRSDKKSLTLYTINNTDTSKEVSCVSKNAPSRTRLVKQGLAVKRKPLFKNKSAELRAKKHTLAKKEVPDPKEYTCSPKIREIFDLWESYGNPKHRNTSKTFKNSVSIIKSLLRGNDLKITGFERFIGIKFSKSDFDFVFKLLKDAKEDISVYPVNKNNIKRIAFPSFVYNPKNDYSLFFDLFVNGLKKVKTTKSKESQEAVMLLDLLVQDGLLSSDNGDMRHISRFVTYALKDLKFHESYIDDVPLVVFPKQKADLMHRFLMSQNGSIKNPSDISSPWVCENFSSYIKDKGIVSKTAVSKDTIELVERIREKYSKTQ